LTVQLLANAKINPTLRVLGRRPDGYHELVTTLLALDIGDSVSVAVADADSIEVTGAFATPDVPLDGSNLALRGADAARVVLCARTPLAVSVTKRLPSRAGLGGGSADAAAAALATRLALGGDVDDRVLGALFDRALGEIGSDCAFFHAARATGVALATGRGADVVPLEGAPGWSIALVIPAVECATPDVYRALGVTAREISPVDIEAEREAARVLFASTAHDARALLVNDLESAARRAQPDLDDWFELLAEVECGHFRLAGSGSGLYGLFDDPADARAALERIETAARGRGLGLRFTAVAGAAGSALAQEHAP
jgi:4-diphosphocytidyl-2-C-methyl-D-erythritol kinase